MKKPKLTRDFLFARLAETFRMYGFEGTTLTILTKNTGLERASLYHYFPGGKKQMAEEVLDYILSSLNEKVLTCFKEPISPDIQILKMLTSIKEFYNGGKNMCFLSIFSVGESSSDIKAKLAEATKEWESQIYRSLKKAEVTEPKKKSQRLLSSIQGSLILSHIYNKPKVFTDLIDFLKKDFPQNL